MNTKVHMRREAGFIQAALLFGIALITAVLGGYALANRTPTSQTDIEQAKVNASVVLKQAADLRDGVQRYAADNGSSAIVGSLDFTAGNNGLYNYTNRYASPQVMPRSAFVTPTSGYGLPISTLTSAAAGHWRLNKAWAANGIGTATADPVVALPALQLEVCRRINNLIHGASVTANPPVSSLDIADLVGSEDGATPPAGGTESGVTAGWSEGCVKAQDVDVYVYFKVVQEN